jgi:succinate dehydrogenase / fumarate reductase, cytochrome b subunit
MSQEATLTVTGSPVGIHPAFWARKLHSLTGVFPIGVFLVEHFFTNSFALFGPQAFNETVEKLQSLPYVIFLEVGLIAVPILYHALYGIMISGQGRPNSFQYCYLRNWMYVLQRLTGVVLLIYIGMHVYETRIMAAIRGEHITYEYVAQELAQPGMFAFYVLGILSAVFHFSSGLWSFLIGWGVTVTERSMRTSAYICTLMGIVLGAIGLNALLAFLGKGFLISI